MRTLINTIRYGWDAARVIRLIIGLLVLTLAAFRADQMMLFFGGWLTLMPLLNASCCGVGGCDINQSKDNQKSTAGAVEITNFEEVKNQ